MKSADSPTFTVDGRGDWISAGCALGAWSSVVVTKTSVTVASEGE